MTGLRTAVRLHLDEFHLQRPFIHKRSHSEALGVRIATNEFLKDTSQLVTKAKDMGEPWNQVTVTRLFSWEEKLTCHSAETRLNVSCWGWRNLIIKIARFLLEPGKKETQTRICHVYPSPAQCESSAIWPPWSYTECPPACSLVLMQSLSKTSWF